MVILLGGTMSNSRFCLSLILIFIILTACSTTDKEHLTKEDVNSLSLKSDSVQVSDNKDLLNNSNDIAKTPTPFTLVKGFIPHEEFVNYLDVQGEKVKYLKVSPNNESIISGDLIIENANDEELVLQTLFLQGNQCSNKTKI